METVFLSEKAQKTTNKIGQTKCLANDLSLRQNYQAMGKRLVITILTKYRPSTSW